MVAAATGFWPPDRRPAAPGHGAPSV